ncbi:MAG: TonB-dependent receptor [bacterium]
MKLLKTIILLFVLTCPAMSQARYGSIGGTINDSQTAEPLTGATIMLQGTFLGAVSDGKGEYRIDNIPPGSYTVVASMVGYEKKSSLRILVRSGEKTQLDVSLLQAEILANMMVITGSRREQSYQDVPVSISTVSAREIAQRTSVTFDEVLRYIPGVNMTLDQVNIRGSSGYSRGVGSRVLLLLDGLPYLTGDTGEINWETIPTHMIDRVEVVKGAGSALYGSSALGGVINVITRELQSGHETRFRFYSGMYDKTRYPEWEWTSKRRFNSGGIVSYANKSGALSYLLSISRSVDESYRQNDTYHRWGLFAKARYDFTPTQSISLLCNFLDRQHGNYFWWKSLSEPLRPDDGQLNGLVTTKRGSVGIAYKEIFSEKLIYSVKGMYFGNFWRDDSLGRLNNVSTAHLFHGEAQATYEFSPSNIFTFGISCQYDWVDANLFGRQPGAGAAVYAQDEFSIIDQLKVTLGGRLDWQRVSILPATLQLNPKIGVVYSPDDETSIRASVGSGFRYPGIGEIFIESSTNVSQVVVLPNTELKVEKSISFEVGIKRAFGQYLSFDFSLFNNEFQNLIEPSVIIKSYKRTPASITEDAGPGPVIQFENVTKARISGAEISFRIDWLKKYISTEFGYTYISPLDVNQDTVLKFRPRHLLNCTLSITLDHWNAGVDARYISRVERIDEKLVYFAQITDGEKRVPIKVVDARLSYDLVRLGLPLRLGLNVTNLLNYHYVEFLGNLSPVRTYYLILEGMF